MTAIIYTIDHTKISEAITNDFLVGINISSTSGFMDELSASDWQYLNVTVNDTNCYTEVDKWDADANEATIWVNVPSVSSTEDTPIRIAIGDANPTYVSLVGGSACQSAWANYEAAWHMTQDPSADILDSSAGGYDLTTGAGMSLLDDDFGNGIDFGSESGYLYGDANQYSSESTTIIKFNITSYPAPEYYYSLVHQGDHSSFGNEGWVIYVSDSGTIRLQYMGTEWWVYYEASETCALGDNIVIISYSETSDELIINVNGVSETFPVSSTYSWPAVAPVYVGATKTVGLYRFFDGTIDELLIANWAVTDYESDAITSMLLGELFTVSDGELDESEPEPDPGTPFTYIAPPVEATYEEYDTYIDLMTDNYDIIINDNRVMMENGFETLIYNSLLTDQRAPKELVRDPFRRRGWLGDVTDSKNRKIGSLLWLLEQRRLTQDTINAARDYTEKALEWMVEDGLASEINVSADFDTNSIRLDIEIVINRSDIATKYVSLWITTG